MPHIAIYDWSLFTLPTALQMSNITGNTNPNDPNSPDYNSGQPSWLGEPFTYNGGASTPIEITDDDDNFEDGYVETGGAQTLTQPVTINGTTYSAGSVIENEFSMLDAAGNEIFIVRIDGENVGFAYPSGQAPTAGSTFTGTQGRDGAPDDNADGVSSSSEPYADIVCFAKGTYILTPHGERMIETLKTGDLVVTSDHGAQPIRWLRHFDHALETVEATSQPVLISVNALGHGHPTTDLIVSAQHRVLVAGGGQLDGLFESQSFAPAKSLTALPGVHHLKDVKHITLIHFACDQHEVVTANGCLSESLLLGPMVMNGLTPSERQKLTAIYGVSALSNISLNGPAARKCLTVGAVQRHLASRKSEQFRCVSIKPPMPCLAPSPQHMAV